VLPRRISIEERIKRLQENKAYAMEQAAKRVAAIYQARIDLLRERGLPPKEERMVPRSLPEMVAKGKDRWIFFRTRFYVHMGLSPSEARGKAEREYEKYKAKFLIAMRG